MTRKVIQAIRRRDPAMLAKLLAQGHFPGRRPRDPDSPLGQAAEYSTPEIVRLLLEAGAPAEDYSDFSFSPLYRAIYHRGDDDGRLEIVRLLVDAGADMGRLTGSPSILYVAIKGRRYEVIRFLMERGCPLWPLWDDGGQQLSQKIAHLAENPREQRYLHEQFADYLATQVGSDLYRSYYDTVPFKPDRVREKQVQEGALRRRIEEQRLRRELHPAPPADSIVDDHSSESAQP